MSLRLVHKCRYVHSVGQGDNRHHHLFGSRNSGDVTLPGGVFSKQDRSRLQGTDFAVAGLDTPLA